MNLFELTALLAVSGLAIGFLGSLTGLGGGFIVVPLLVLGFGVDIRYAIGASLVTVIATSSGAAAAYVRDGYANIRIAMFLEVGTTLGALAGTSLALALPKQAIGVLFGIVLLHAAWLNLRKRSEGKTSGGGSAVAAYFGMDGAYPGAAGLVSYQAHRVPVCFGLMTVAGVLSGLLGIGSGIVKVLAMDQVMGLPFKVSTATSNFMIGVTAAAGAGVYFSRGYIDPGLAMPVVPGVLAGAFLGARLLPRVETRRLRVLFAAAIACAAGEMIYNGVAGKF